MSVDDNLRLANAFLADFNERTSSDIYTTDSVVWNNLTGTEQTHESTVAVTRMLQDAIPDLRWEDTVAHAWDDGFTVEYTFRATLPDGNELRVPACGVATVRGGRIARFDEYIDSAQVAPMGQALLASRAGG